MQLKHYQNVLKPLKTLTAYINNARTHSDDQIEQIAYSIQEFGFTNPVLIDELGMIIAGHGRVMAAKQLGIEQVPCIILEGLSELQKRAYVLADNRIAENAGWNEALLKLELEALDLAGFDMDFAGFDIDNIDIDTTDVDVDTNLNDGEHKQSKQCPNCGFEI
jgi:ParB-like chromosome segregation protein Spo0J